MKPFKPLIITLGISVALNIALFILLVFITSRESDVISQASAQLTSLAVPLAGIEPVIDEVASCSSENGSVERGAALTETVAVAMPTATPEPTVPPTLAITLQPSPTSMASPPPALTATPTGERLPTASASQGPPWLQYLNQFRFQAGLSAVNENIDWSEGSRLHSEYMSNTGSITRYEDSRSEYFTKAGEAAGANSNLATSFFSATPYEWAFHYWISAPFQGLPILDPQLETVGFGTYRHANAAIEVAATLDVKQGLQQELPVSDVYPILFPKDGGQIWVLRYSLPEVPDGRVHCGYGQLAGAPIYVQIGSGDQIPEVTSSVLLQGESVIEHCTFDETNYANPQASLQQMGRGILDQRDAVILLPRNPLEVGKTYIVELVVNGMAINWSFETVPPPPRP